MFNGITIEKLLLIGLIAGMIIGPQRLPRYAAALGQFVRRARDFARSAGSRVKEEMGEDFDDVDWRTLDPRQYDPRRIIREALLDAPPTPPVKPQSATMAAAGTAAAAAESATSTKAPPLAAGETPPFDAEAT